MGKWAPNQNAQSIKKASFELLKRDPTTQPPLRCIFKWGEIRPHCQGDPTHFGSPKYGCDPRFKMDKCDPNQGAPSLEKRAPNP